MKIIKYWLFLAFPMTALAVPGVDIDVINDTVMKVKYSGSTPQSVHPVVLVEGKRIGLEVKSTGTDPVGVKVNASSSANYHAITGLRMTATNNGGSGVYTVGIQGEAYGANNSDYTYGGIFTANAGSVNTGVLATADGNSAIAVRAIGYGSGSLAGQFDGDVVVNGYLTHLSDGKFKKNVRGIDSALAKVKKLRPVMYEMKTDEYRGRVALSSGSQYGVIAEEVKTVVPHLVKETSILPVLTAEDIKNRVNKERLEYSSVDYTGFIPLLIKAMQEQQLRIEMMQAEIASLRTSAK